MDPMANCSVLAPLMPHVHFRLPYWPPLLIDEHTVVDCLVLLFLSISV